MNIRVVNLSYGAPATPDWRRDPLAWASEVAWRKGVLVVAAAGNEGTGHQLSSPAYSPEILAVGATETEVTRGGRTEYTIAPYTSTGQRRRPDLFVPGGHVISLRTKGSFVDTFLAKKNVGERFTRGSGTSQAAAVASGLAALLIEAYPTATPDQIKSMMIDATDFSGNRRDVTGIEASIDVTEAFKSAKKKLPTVQLSNPFATCGDTWCRGIGDGSAAFVDWAKAAWAGNSWSGSSWTGNSWTGSSWSGSSWTGNSWTGSSWTGSSWTGSSWTGSYWTGSSWTQDVWAGSSWTGSSWTGSSWTGSSWTGSSWTGSSWAGSSWAGSSWAGTWDQ
jgi:serine protease AprX